ncbi:hypothetical protein KJ059_17230 [Myxococcota bacterium]|nr:hypothetical protein [Myxococcota bacterium]MCZ7617945.1 hypothetical protein [Myxococcota bacterium]
MRSFLLLAFEAARDAFRRRFVVAIAVVLTLSLLWVRSCIDFGPVQVNQQAVDPALIAGFLAPILFSLQALSVLVITGVLASDHLARPLADGSSTLWLARPISRDAYAGARLTGALAVALGAGAVLLGGTAALLAARHGVAVAPALLAAAATALGSIVVAALAMALSLAIGRTAVLLAVLVAVPLQGFANALRLALALVQPDAALPDALAAFDRFGPPLGTAVFAAVAAWHPHVDVSGMLLPALGRLALWAAGAVALLMIVFRRIDIPR